MTSKGPAFNQFLTLYSDFYPGKVQEMNELIPNLLKEISPDELIDIPPNFVPHSLLYFFAYYPKVDYGLLLKERDEPVNLNVSSTPGITPLGAACQSGNEKAAKLLLDHGCQVTIPIWELCYGTITDEKIAILKLLIEYGANINSECFSYDWHYPVTESVLLYYIREIWSPNRLASPLSCEKNGLFLKELLNSGASINYINSQGENALHLACSRGDFDIAKILLENGCDYNLRNENGKLPIDRLVSDTSRAQFLEIINCIECR